MSMDLQGVCDLGLQNAILVPLVNRLIICYNLLANKHLRHVRLLASGCDPIAGDQLLIREVHLCMQEYGQKKSCRSAMQAFHSRRTAPMLVVYTVRPWGNIIAARNV